MALADGDVCGHENDFFGIRSAATRAAARGRRRADRRAGARQPLRRLRRSAPRCRFTPRSSSTCSAKATPRRSTCRPRPTRRATSRACRSSSRTSSPTPVRSSSGWSPTAPTATSAARWSCRATAPAPNVHPGRRPLPHLQGRRHPAQRLPVLPRPRRGRGLRRAGQSERRDLVLRLEDARTASARAPTSPPTTSTSATSTWCGAWSPPARPAAASPSTSATPPAPTASRRPRSTGCSRTAIDDKNKVACVAMEYTPVDRGERRPAVHQVLHLRPGRDPAALDQPRRPRREVHARLVRRLPWRLDLQRPLPRAGDGLALPRRALPAVRHRQLPVLVASRRCPRRRRARRSTSSTSWCSPPRSTRTAPPAGSSTAGTPNGHVLDKDYVPPAWQLADAQPATAGAARFYKEVIGISCRTCHVSLGATVRLGRHRPRRRSRASTNFCGGTADVAVNASMPNALISRDRLFEKHRRRRLAGGAGGRSSSAAPRRCPTRSMPSADRRTGRIDAVPLGPEPSSGAHA